MRRPLFVATMCAISMAVFAGGAQAYFHSPGSGAGTATTGTLQPVNISEAGANLALVLL